MSMMVLQNWASISGTGSTQGPQGYSFSGQREFFLTGYTKQLVASAPVSANTPTTVTITVSDVSDSRYDSAIFVSAAVWSPVQATVQQVVHPVIR